MCLRCAEAHPRRGLPPENTVEHKVVLSAPRPRAPSSTLATLDHVCICGLRHGSLISHACTHHKRRSAPASTTTAGGLAAASVISLSAGGCCDTQLHNPTKLAIHFAYTSRWPTSCPNSANAHERQTMKKNTTRKEGGRASPRAGATDHHTLKSR